MMTTKEDQKQVKETKEEESSLMMNRRTFIKLAGAGTAGVAALGYLSFSPSKLMTASAEPDPNEGDAGVTLTRSFCLMCHSDCGLQAKIKDGVIVKLDGNPYHPAANDYTSTNDMVAEDEVDFDKTKDVGTLCPKGQAGIMTMYDPYRVRYPLKRVGSRGSGKWEKLTWKTALNEIKDGGDLFGEGAVLGLTAIADAVNPIDPGDIYDDGERDSGKTSLDWWGPKANQFLFYYGRNMQKDFTKRFVNKGLGSKNHHGHTSICEATQKVAHENTFRNSNTYDPLGSGLDEGFPIKGKDHFKPDIKGCDNLVVAGAAYLEANFPMQACARYSMEAIDSGKQVWVVNPRFTKLAAKGVKWIPVKVGGDAALGMGLLKYIIEDPDGKGAPLYDDTFLRYCNNTISGGEAWTDACFIVREDTGMYVRDSDVGVGSNDVPVVWDGSVFVAHETPTTAPADLPVLDHSSTYDFGAGAVNINSVFNLLKTKVASYTFANLNDTAGLTGMTGKEIQNIGDFLTESGKRTAIDYYKGPSQQTQGYHACRAYTLVNVLLGNIDKKGGMNAGGGHYDYSAPSASGGLSTKGLYIERHGKFYPSAPVSTATPARQFFPFANHGVCQEVWPSVKMGYPYKVKAVMQYYQDFAYTYPYNQIVYDAMLDMSATPLIISIDAFMGESSALGDYILPDTCYLERWTIYHSHPPVKTKVTAIRQPVLQGNIQDVTIAGHNTKVYVSPMGSLTGSSFTTVDDFLDAFEGPMVMETILCSLANKMGLPTFGVDAMGAGKHLYTAWDYNNEYAMSGDLGEGLAPTTKDYMTIAGQYENPANVYDAGDPNLLRNRYKKVCTLYVEQMALKANALNGADMYEPLPTVEGLKDIAGVDIDDESAGYDFLIISHKAVQHTQSRTGQNAWLMQLQPENWAEMNKEDADALGVSTGDWIRIISPTNKEGVRIKAKVSQHIRKKTIDVPWGWGHTEFGAKAYYVDGVSSGSNKLLGMGVNVNSVMRADPYYYDNNKPASVTSDRIGGSSNQYVHHVKVRRG
jgi:anaerobic selenocysteine-containing dehydrogenase